MKQTALRGSIIILPLLIIFISSIIFKVNLYSILAATLPAFWFLSLIRKGSLLEFTLIITVIVNFGYQLFVNYMVHPWFKTDPNNCDGPCYGWYMFEEPMLPEFIILNLTLAISLSCTLLICKFYWKN